MYLQIKKITSKKDIPWNLLLTADPARDLVEDYLSKGISYVALTEGKIVGVYVLVSVSEDVAELKNISVEEKYQGMGIGKKLLLNAIKQAKEIGVKKIDVGTGNSSFSQLAFYQKLGFRIVGIDKDFFIKNYKEEIIENGIKCADMIRLSLDI